MYALVSQVMYSLHFQIAEGKASMFKAAQVLLRVMSPLVVGFGLNAGVHAQPDVVLVGAAFVDLKCWTAVMSTVNIHHMEQPMPGNDRWLKETFPKQFANPITSTEMPQMPQRANGLPTAFVDFLAYKARTDHVDLGKCFVTEDKLPIYAKHVALLGVVTGVEGRVKDLEERYTAARNVEMDLVGRLARMKESMTALEEELVRLRATPTKAPAVKAK